MNQTRKLQIVALLLFLVMSVVGYRLTRVDGPNLLQQAHRVPNAPSLLTQPDAYFWLSEQEMLYLEPMQKAGAFVVKRWNLQTNQEATQGALQSNGLLLSPNGHWALTVGNTKGGDLFQLERTDGKRQFRYQSPSAEGTTDIAWLPDDRGLIELHYTGTGYQLKTYPLDKPAVLPEVEVQLADLPTLLGVTPDNHLMAALTTRYHPSLPARKDVTLFDIPLPSGIPVSTLHIPTPHGQDDTLDEIVMSPQGDRLAWLLQYKQSPPLYSQLSGLYRLLGIEQGTRVGIWISKPDGSAMHAAGTVLLKPDEILPTCLRWTPDGKQISFLLRNGLYLLPAN